MTDVMVMTMTHGDDAHAERGGDVDDDGDDAMFSILPRSCSRSLQDMSRAFNILK